MTTRLRTKLLEQIGTRTDGWVFPSPRYPGQPIQRQALTVAWRKAANKAGVALRQSVCARHTFGTDAMEATKNPFKVMRVMGHTTLAPPSATSITKRQEWANCWKRHEIYVYDTIFTTQWTK